MQSGLNLWKKWSYSEALGITSKFFRILQMQSQQKWSKIKKFSICGKPYRTNTKQICLPWVFPNCTGTRKWNLLTCLSLFLKTCEWSAFPCKWSCHQVTNCYKVILEVLRSNTESSCMSHWIKLKGNTVLFHNCVYVKYTHTK